MTESIMAASSVESAYARTYEEHWFAVFRFALAWTNDAAAAEDLVQEAFVRLWSNRTRVNWSSPLLGWLLTTTRRLATDRFRSIRRRSRHVLGPTSTAGGLSDRWLDVRSAMARLSSLERTAIILTTLEGHSYGDAARVLGTTPAALRAAVSRARNKLEAD